MRGRWRPENFIAGDPALELANTIAHRRDQDLAEDRIAQRGDLADWAASLELDGLCAPIRSSDVVAVAELRAVVHEAFASIADRRSPPDAAVARLLRTAASGIERSGRPSLAELLAWNALEALIRLPRERIGSCPSCGWLFFDTSKSGRRRWCAMATCGTAAKVRRFRASHPSDR